MGEGTGMRMTNHQQQFKRRRLWTQEGIQHMKWHVCEDISQEQNQSDNLLRIRGKCFFYK